MASVEVGHVNVRPSGDLESGRSNVTADLQMNFISIGGQTFPSDESISLRTELENPVWTYSIILDGVVNPRPPVSRKQLDLSGWELSYENVDENVKVSLKGMAPNVDSSREIVVVSVNVATPEAGSRRRLRCHGFVANPGLKGDISSVRMPIPGLKRHSPEQG